MAGLAAGLADQWRDLAPTLWIIAGTTVLLWVGLLALCAALTEPRKVDPGAATLDLAGPEPPAVANLVACDWRLGQDSLPATLLDLAARKHLSIDQYGDQTLVRVAGGGASTGPSLVDYEELVLAHVRHLARDNSDGVVPAEALTTGPDETSKGWWRDFRKAVEDDARQRGLSRARWSRGLHILLVVTALVAAAMVGLAVSSIPESNSSESSDSTDSSSEDGQAIAFDLGLVAVAFAWGGLVGAVELVGRRERDTPAGREAAARWLGFRSLLAQDTLFAEHPPAGVAIWDRHLAYGAALGLAHAAVQALPLGAESDTSAWSPVGGRWRLVRIRYPRLQPGYGRHPLRTAAVGLILTTAGLLVVTRLPLDIDKLVEPLRDNPELGEYVGRDEVQLVGQIVLTVVFAGFSLATAVGAWMLLVGLVDLVRGRRVVEGRVLRYRARGSDDSRRYVAVDDGTANVIRAWRIRSVPRPTQGTIVRASVTRHLQHVRDFSVSHSLSASSD